MRNTKAFVLSALGILGPDEILKLSAITHHTQVAFKMAAGEELVSWVKDEQLPAQPQQKLDARIIPFPKKSFMPEALVPEKAEEVDEDDAPKILSSDVVLLQRELTREIDENAHKLNASSGYKKATEMYVIKGDPAAGKERIRFASTNGVLVNKKMA